MKTKKIAVGDIVCVRAEEDFPCDLVLLTSSDREGQCHIQTANLDGETNLKVGTPSIHLQHSVVSQANWSIVIYRGGWGSGAG